MNRDSSESDGWLLPAVALFVIICAAAGFTLGYGFN